MPSLDEFRIVVGLDLDLLVPNDLEEVFEMTRRKILWVNVYLLALGLMTSLPSFADGSLRGHSELLAAPKKVAINFYCDAESLWVRAEPRHPDFGDAALISGIHADCDGEARDLNRLFRLKRFELGSSVDFNTCGVIAHFTYWSIWNQLVHLIIDSTGILNASKETIDQQEATSPDDWRNQFLECQYVRRWGPRS